MRPPGAVTGAVLSHPFGTMAAAVEIAAIFIIAKRAGRAVTPRALAGVAGIAAGAVRTRAVHASAEITAVSAKIPRTGAKRA